MREMTTQMQPMSRNLSKAWVIGEGGGRYSPTWYGGGGYPTMSYVMAVRERAAG